jgi:hypothetical protein
MLYIIAILIGVTIVVRVIYCAAKYPFLNKKIWQIERDYDKLKKEYANIQNENNQYKMRVEQLTNCINQKDNLFKSYQNTNMAKIAFMYADMITLQYHLTEEALRNNGVEVCYPKGRRFVRTTVYAPKSADKVKILEEETKGYIEQYKCMLYKYNALLEAFPDLAKYVDDLESIKALNSFSKLEKNARFYQLKNIIDEKNKQLERIKSELNKEKADVKRIVKEAELGETKFLQTLISDYYANGYVELVDSFTEKKYPIQPETANQLKSKINNDLRLLRNINKELEYFAKLAIETFPELEQFTPFELLVEERKIEEEYHRISEEAYHRLSDEEYHRLEPSEKNQMKLDMWWTRKKPNEIIGRDYERYIGYLFEKENYEVYYQGIKKGRRDEGIDLICEKNNEILLIQCKRWASFRNINENVICQLYGTWIKYRFDIKNTGLLFLPNIKNILCISSDILTNMAKDYAKALEINIIMEPMKKYPIIKCNIGKDINGNPTKIYHFPFDQQYDTTRIDKSKGEFYAMTVKEAEDAGFRRAYRWQGTE